MIIYLGHHKEFLCWHFKLLPFVIPFTLNSIAKTKLSCCPLPLGQHHSFLRNLPPNDWNWLGLWCPEMHAVTKMAKIHLIVKWAELISLQSIWLKFVNFAEQILFWQICLKNWPKSSNPLTFTQFDKIWSNLPFLLLCEFLDISEDWWNVSSLPQLKIVLNWATLDWTGFITIYFFWSW